MNQEKTRSNQLTRRTVLQMLGAAGISLAAVDAAQLETTAQTKIIESDPRNGNLQGAGFYRFKIGALECISVSDGFLQLPAAEFFAAPQAEIEQILRDHFLPTTQLTLQLNTLVVKTGGQVVLMDTGGGKNVGPTAGLLPVNLSKAGVKPEEITDVVFSHAHFDHIGGTITADKKIFFPKAKFHISQREWDEAIRKKDYFGGRKVDPAIANSIFAAIDEDLAPLKERITFFTSPTEIAPGVTAIPAEGHTPGHAVYQIKSGADSLLYVGDLIHHAAVQLARPEITMFGDSFPAQSSQERIKILARLAAERQLMMGAHLTFPGVGHLRARSGKGASYDWMPLEWQW